ncbi:MAG: hypothetical protein Q4P11_00380 [Methanobrevibacter sp.]|nr:hypothetical protein [Methanobrevibacter sp.]
MRISFDPMGSREQFHDNQNVVHLVNLCFEHCGDELFNDILLLIKRTSLEKAEDYLNAMEKKYNRIGKISLFHDLKSTFLEIYSDDQVANLRGGFLELLSSRVFNDLFVVNMSSFDCKVIIEKGSVGKWCSPKTVDIGIGCESEGLVSECKISKSDLDYEIINNLLMIKEKSNGFFSLFVVTLEDERELYLRLREIKFQNPFYDLNKIAVVSKDNFYNFCTGSFEKYDDIKKSVFVKNLA